MIDSRNSLNNLMVYPSGNNVSPSQPSTDASNIEHSELLSRLRNGDVSKPECEAILNNLSPFLDDYSMSNNTDANHPVVNATIKSLCTYNDSLKLASSNGHVQTSKQNFKNDLVHNLHSLSSSDYSTSDDASLYANTNDSNDYGSDIDDLRKLVGSNTELLVYLALILSTYTLEGTLGNLNDRMNANKANVEALNTAGAALGGLVDPTVLVDVNGNQITDYTTLIDDYKNHPERLSAATQKALAPFIQQLQGLKDSNGNSYWDQIGQKPSSTGTINAMLNDFMQQAASHLSTGSLIGFTTNPDGSYAINVADNNSNLSTITREATSEQNVQTQDAQELTLIQNILQMLAQCSSVVLNGYKNATNSLLQR